MRGGRGAGGSGLGPGPGRTCGRREPARQSRRRVPGAVRPSARKFSFRSRRSGGARGPLTRGFPKMEKRAESSRHPGPGPGSSGPGRRLGPGTGVAGGARRRGRRSGFRSAPRPGDPRPQRRGLRRRRGARRPGHPSARRRGRRRRPRPRRRDRAARDGKRLISLWPRHPRERAAPGPGRAPTEPASGQVTGGPRPVPGLGRTRTPEKPRIAPTLDRPQTDPDPG